MKHVRWKKKSASGFTFIEIIVFIIVSSLLMSTFLLSARTALLAAPATHYQWVAMETARQCMEWFLGQRRFNGYTTLTCPSTPTATACAVPSGFSISTSVACTTWNSDSNYKTITVSVTGLATASLSVQVGASS